MDESSANTEAWTIRDAIRWQGLAQTAAETLATLWDKSNRRFVSRCVGEIPDAKEEDTLVPGCCATEALIALNDALSNLLPQSARDIIGTCALEISNTKLPTPVNENADVDELSDQALKAAVLTAVLTRIALLAESELQSDQKPNSVEAKKNARARLRTEVVERLCVSAEYLCERAKGSESKTFHPYLLFQVARSLWLAEFALTDQSETLRNEEVETTKNIAADQESAKQKKVADIPQSIQSEGEAKSNKETQAELLVRVSVTRERLIRVIRSATDDLVAKHELQPTGAHEAVGLAFCAASLALPPTGNFRYVDTAVRACLSARTPNGGWPLVRFGGSTGLGGIHNLTSLEIAWALSETLLAPIRARASVTERLPADALRALVVAAQDAEQSVIELPVPEKGGAIRGWSAEVIYGRSSVEVMATASALLFAVGLQQLTGEVRSLEALQSFRSYIDSANDYWPDWIRWDEYRLNNEPDEEVNILDWLNRRVVEPCLSMKPPWARQPGQIILMFGPPGTTKTTIVRSVAQGLKWPLVILSPGDFITRGLDLIEAQASEVFTRLHDLVRAVVVFDECDELFRHRGHEAAGNPEQSGGDQRGIGAFVTASMLPKLQDLHDRGQVLVFVLTNYFHRMDPAIRRLGRIDAIVGVGPPDIAQRRRTIHKILETVAAVADVLDVAVNALADETTRYTRPELLNATEKFSAELASSSKRGDVLTENKIRQVAKSVCDRFNESITVREEDEKDFDETARKVSFPHMERHGDS